MTTLTDVKWYILIFEYLFLIFRYQDYENESDDEVDWKELAKAIEKYQTMNGILQSFILHFSTKT